MRLLAAFERAKPMTTGILQSEAAYRAGGKAMPDQANGLFITKIMDPLRLTLEAESVSSDSPFHVMISAVAGPLDELKVGSEFRTSVEALDQALAEGISSLREWTASEDSKIEDIIDELERALLLSLLVTVTSHTFVVQWSDRWLREHERYLDGKVTADQPHFIQLPGLTPCHAPGRGIVHVQQLLSALTGDISIFIAGASRSKVDHYPELQSIVYSQWFAYAHAIWDEQFRERVAAFFSTTDAPLEKNDVINDYFGDIRRIRNDFVHRKGIANEAVKVQLLKWGFIQGEPLEITTEQMLSLVDLFPREALGVKPTARTTSNRTNVPGSVDTVIMDSFLARTSELKIDKNGALDEAIADWVKSKS